MLANLARIVPLLLVAAGGGVACSTATDAAPPASGPQDLFGHSFTSSAVEGTQIPGDGPLQLTFTDPDRISARAGCNSMTGTVDLSGHTVDTGLLATTRMACPGDRAGADEWATSLLQADPSWTLEGETLTLKAPDRTVTLHETQTPQ